MRWMNEQFEQGGGQLTYKQRCGVMNNNFAKRWH